MLKAPVLVAQFHWADEIRPSHDAALREIFLSGAEHSLNRYWRDCTFGFVDIGTDGQVLAMQPLDLTHDTYVDDKGEVQSRRQRDEVLAHAFAAAPGLVPGHRPKIVFMFDNPSPAGAIGSAAVLDFAGSHTYMAHELGHTLGFAHSYGGGVEYGDPYCVMSALTFGGFNPTHRRMRPPGSAVPAALPTGTMRYWDAFGPMPSAATLFRRLPEFAASPMVRRVGRDEPVRLTALSEAAPGQTVLAVTEIDGVTWTAELRIATGWDRGLAGGPGEAVVLHSVRQAGDSLRVVYEGHVPLTAAGADAEVQPADRRAEVRLVVDDPAPGARAATVRFTFRRRDWGAIVELAPQGHAVPGALSAISRNPDVVDVFWVGPDGGVGHTSWNTGMGRWAPPDRVAPVGTAALRALATSSRNPDNLDLFWIGRDGSVRHLAWTGAAWGDVVELAPQGHAVPGAVNAMARNADVVDVFWVGPDGGVGHTSWNTGMGHWAPPDSFAPPGSAVPGALATSSRNPDNLDVFWVGPDGGVGHRAWNTPGWGDVVRLAPPGTVAQGALAATTRHPDNVDLFWVRHDGAVGHRAWNA